MPRLSGVDRVMTDNGPGYRSGKFNGLFESESVPMSM